MRIPRRHAPFRKAFLILVYTTLALIAGRVVTGAVPAPSAIDQASGARARPNVVVIETDDQTVESMRVMNNVNTLIGDLGTRFQNSFVNYSLCCPSLATFLTGQYAHNHGVLTLGPDGGFDRFQSLHGHNNLAIWLQDAGYYTSMIGKYLYGYANQPPVPPGWSEWHVAAPRTQYYYDYTINNNGTRVNYGHEPADYKTDVLTGKAVSLINRRAPNARPFFLWVTYASPHSGAPNSSPNPPFDCFRSSQWPAVPQATAKPAPRHAHAFDSAPLPKPPSFNEADVSDKPAMIRDAPRLTQSQISQIQRKYRCRLKALLSVDEGVKKIVDAVRAKAELGNTVLIFTSDNGYFHGEHRIPEEKRHIYEESIRVPLAMRGPGIPSGVRVESLAINADLAPTILDVANASPGQAMDGRSLIPLAQQPDIGRGRELLIEEPRAGRWPGFEAIRTERYMYAEHGTGEKELYDLTRDPFELRSRHDDPAYASVRAALADRLHQLRDCTGSNCVDPLAASGLGSPIHP
jgi:N-acetylglucosamine-6-sulfatase